HGRVHVGWGRTPTHCEVWVEDEGPGLSNTSNLFVPFFTTKPDGSGIGLVLSRQIAEAHGGSLTVPNRQAGPRVRSPPAAAPSVTGVRRRSPAHRMTYCKMSRAATELCLFSLLACLAGCSGGEVEQSSQVEIVMTPGMEIRAQTPNGKIGIRAGPGFKRTYFWDSDCEGSVTLWPRVERWHGSLGLYYPGPGNTWWFSCGG